MRKRSIFCQKPWTNPFANFLFFGLFLTLLFWSKKHSCLFRISKNDLLWLHIPKYTLEKKVDFCANFTIPGSKKHFFLSRISKNDILWLGFPRKTHMRKRSIF